jgi:hypothetical protein
MARSVPPSRGKPLDHGMPAVERNLRQRRDEVGRDVARNHETAHHILRACVEDVDDDEFRRVAPVRAARAKKCEERGSGPAREGQSVA